MPIRETIQIGDPLLKAANQAVTDFGDSKVKQVITDLIDTMRKEELVGMAAPQIGENWQVFVTEPRETEARKDGQTDILRVYINPKIVEAEGEALIYEGCGSVIHGGIFGQVKRPKVVTVEAADMEGKMFRLKCDGILARVIKHEMDHLAGVEFIEKAHDYKKLLNREYYIENVRGSAPQVEAGKITVKEVKEIH